MADMLGYPPEEILGRSILEFICQESLEIVSQHVAQRREGLRSTYDAKLSHNDGSAVWVIISGSPLNNRMGQYDGSFSMITNITERIQSQEELHRRQEQLIQADKMASLGILVSGVAHEINNPTALILMSIPTVAGAVKDFRPILEHYFHEHGDFSCGGIPYSRMRDILPEMIDDVHQSGLRIKQIVEDLAGFARQSPSGFSEAVDLNRVVKGAVRMLHSQIRKSTCHFQLRLSEALPSVLGNFQRIEQVVVNLLLNACQSLPDKERRITVTTSLSLRDEEAVIEVSDEGVGIDPEHLPFVMDPFFTTKRDMGGTGLGLSVSAGIVKEHGGSLVFHSTPGKGTTALLTLPAPKSEEI
jgi:polar amino acid transport system substrate-binding protein